MTYLTQEQFDSYPAYDCSVPTFHENWLTPGRYWTYTPSNFNAPDLKKYIACYVECGENVVKGVYDEVMIIPELSADPEVAKSQLAYVLLERVIEGMASIGFKEVKP